MDGNGGARFIPAVCDVLVGAGWSPGRHLADERIRYWKEQLEGFVMFEAAERVLREFGGLSVDRLCPGLEVMCSPFAIDPLLAQHEDDLFRGHTDEIGIEFFPLGEGAQHFYFLAIDPDGRTYYVMGDVLLLGETFDAALEALILGKRGRSLR